MTADYLFILFISVLTFSICGSEEVRLTIFITNSISTAKDTPSLPILQLPIIIRFSVPFQVPSKANWWTYPSHVTWKNVANTHSCSPQSTRLYSSLNCIFISVNSVSFLTKNVSFPHNLSSEDNCKSFINSWYLHDSTHFSQKEILHQKPHFLLQKDSKTRLKQSKNSKIFRG